MVGNLCYTGDVGDTTREKYTLSYYVNLAKELEKRGIHSLAIKDMSGLLRPYAAKQLVCIVEKAVEEYNVVVAQLALTDKEAGGKIVGHPDKGGINVLLEAVFFCSIHCFTVLRGCQA